MEINKKNLLPWWMIPAFSRVYGESTTKSSKISVTAKWRRPKWFWFCIIFILGWTWYWILKFAKLFKKDI